MPNNNPPSDERAEILLSLPIVSISWAAVNQDEKAEYILSNALNGLHNSSIFEFLRGSNSTQCLQPPSLWRRWEVQIRHVVPIRALPLRPCVLSSQCR